MVERVLKPWRAGLPDQETRRCALLVKRHALSPFAAPAGLAATVHCCCLALVHCRRLQASHALALAPTLLRELWPACEQVWNQTCPSHPACLVKLQHLSSYGSSTP